MKEVMILKPTITPKLIRDDFKVSMSLIPIEKPIPRIGPISGEISMAPITTAVELTFKPMEAIKIEKTKIQAVCPFIEIPSLIFLAVVSRSVSFFMSKSSVRKSFKL